MKYLTNEGIIEIPEDLADRTVNMLMTKDGKGISYTISRDELQEAESFEDFLNRQLKDLSRQVSGFSEQERLEVHFGNSPQVGYDIKSFFKQNGREFHQRQAVVLLKNLKSVLIVTGTSFNKWSEADSAAWQAMLKNSQLH